MKTKEKHFNRKTFYKLLDSFEEKDFYAVKNFAESIKTKNSKESSKISYLMYRSITNHYLMKP